VKALCAARECGPNPEPTETPSPTPTATPSESPTATPTPTPTDEPTPGTIYSAEGRILGSNPASLAGAGVTENDFVLECAVPLSQGVDGYVFELPADLNLTGATATISGSESLIDAHDLDMYFYSADCEQLSAQNTAESDETAPVPAGTRFIVANAWIGIDTLVELTIARVAPTVDPTATPTPTPTATDEPTDPTTPTRGTYPTDPNDPLFADQWGMTKIQAPQAWQETNATGFGINIAVVDSGLDLGHEDFACPGKLKVLPGSDHVGNDGSPQDDNGHGTHVAGIAGACTDNGKGVIGVAPDATIMPIRHAGGAIDPADLDAGMARGIRFATENGAHVINLSIGDIPPFSHLGKFGYPETEEAMNEARNAGVVIAAAAGNFDQPTCEYPSFSRNVICVVATDRDDMRAWYTDFPVNADPDSEQPKIEPVVAAPGGQGTFCEEGIVSTYLRSEESTCYTEGYDSLDGTSMSSPHVAGLAALLYDRVGGARSKANADLIVNTILETSDDLYTPGWDPIVGYGRINALAAVQALPDPEPTVTPTATPTATPSESPTEPQAADTTIAFTDNTSESAQYTDSATLEAVLTDNATGAPIANAPVVFELDGSGEPRAFEAVTDATGTATVTFDVEDAPGLYDLTVRYEGEEGVYNGDADGRVFTIDRETTTSSLQIEGKGSKRTLTARLVQSGEDLPVAGKTIGFWVDGTKVGEAVTNADGTATFDLAKKDSSGHHDYQAVFEQDDYFAGSAASASTQKEKGKG
jgi:subtilisin family serine protease